MGWLPGNTAIYQFILSYLRFHQQTQKMPIPEQPIEVEKRQAITISFIRWTRFLLVPVLFALLLQIISESEDRALHFIYLFLTIGLYLLLYNKRRLKHDSKNLYIIRGKKEKAVPFSRISSIKKSKSKVNGQRYWILRYTDELAKERKIRFFADFNKPFHDSVRLVNPEVVIWDHPYFHD